MNKFLLFVATGFGIGYLVPKGQGTLATFAVFFLVPWYLGFPFVSQLIVVVGLTTVGIFAASRAESYLGIHDDHRIVIDEIASVAIAFAGVSSTLPWWLFVIVFAVHRFLDIAKPLFINEIQKLPRGWGIMADDVLVGIYTNIFIRLILFIL